MSDFVMECDKVGFHYVAAELNWILYFYWEYLKTSFSFMKIVTALNTGSSWGKGWKESGTRHKRKPQTLNWNNWPPYYLHSWLSVWAPRNVWISFNNSKLLFFALLVQFTQMWLTWSWISCDKSCEMVELFFTVFTYLFCTSLIESLHFIKSALALFARFSLCSLVTLKHTSVIVE